jgi:hypothetical protein
MPLQLPNLDDRTYNDLVAEALNLIPTYAQEWTNYNPSDPGITLIELFAYLSELLIYRLNQVTDANKAAFLKLINGPDWQLEEPLNEAIRKTIQTLRESDRAVTCNDFEHLARQAHPQVARARCVPRINLISDNPLTTAERLGHVSVIVVPRAGSLSSQTVLDTVKAYLDSRRLLTTRISVVEPHDLAVRVRVKLILRLDAIAEKVRSEAVNTLKQFFDSLQGGQQGEGWEFGRPIYISEIYELLDELPGVDYVEKATDPANSTKTLDEVMTLNSADGDRRQFNQQGQLEAIVLRVNELVTAQIDPQDLQFSEVTQR